ncbi:MAG: hypothetical protein AAB510_00685 [Patescibacteria group bacterium]
MFKNIHKDNLHHAYLIEGDSEEVLPILLEFINKLGIQISNNADFTNIQLDSFKIEDARNLKSYVVNRGFSTDKKIFVISANNFLLDAQNSLLKIFEEPIANTHFFVITPDTHTLIQTLVSRFYLISTKQDLTESKIKDAEKFIKMPIKLRLDFIKELTSKIDEAEEQNIETNVLDSTRSKSLKFLNALEQSLHEKVLTRNIHKNYVTFFSHIFKVRKFLREPGSSAKTLMESVALVIPEKF